jgi:hypothetical protein
MVEVEALKEQVLRMVGEMGGYYVIGRGVGWVAKRDGGGAEVAALAAVIQDPKPLKEQVLEIGGMVAWVFSHIFGMGSRWNGGILGERKRTGVGKKAGKEVQVLLLPWWNLRHFFIFQHTGEAALPPPLHGCHPSTSVYQVHSFALFYFTILHLQSAKNTPFFACFYIFHHTGEAAVPPPLHGCHPLHQPGPGGGSGVRTAEAVP